jgi:outer membrane receptor for ferrienterochelin and colicin
MEKYCRITLMIKTTFFILLLPLVLSAASLNNERIDDLFNLSFEDLLNVKIDTAGKTCEKIGEIPASVVILTRQEIERYGYNDLTEALEHIPGLYNINNYEGISGNFGVRGFWNPTYPNGNIAILINGINQKSTKTRSTPFGNIAVPIEAIDRIEVIRGPMSVIYGNGATFGVINIVTNEIGSDEANSVSLRYGSRNSSALTSHITKHEKDIGFTLNASIAKTDGLNYPFSDFGFNSDTLSKSHSSKNRLEQDSKYLNISARYKMFYFDMAFNERNTEFYFLQPSLDSGTRQQVQHNTMMIGYKEQISDWFNLHLKMIYDTVVYRSDHDQFQTDFYAVDTHQENASEYEFLNTSRIGEDSVWLNGINMRQGDYSALTDVPFAQRANEKNQGTDATNIAYFSQLSYFLSSDLKLVMGGRFEKISDYNQYIILNGGTTQQTVTKQSAKSSKIFTPRLSLVYALDENHIFKLLYSEASQVRADFATLESIRTAEVTYLYSHTNINTSINLFQNRLNNLLYITKDANFRDIPHNDGEQHNTGVEWIIQTNYLDSITSQLALTYQDNKDFIHPDITIAYSPNFLAYFKTSYLFNEKDSVALSANYVGKMVSFYDSSANKRIGEGSKAYIYATGNLRLNNIYNDLYLNIHITNLFNQTIRYPNTNVNSENLTLGTLAPMRSYYATLGWNF